MPSLSNPNSANVRRAHKRLRPELENLARALAALQEPERATVVAAANEQGRQRDREQPTLGSDDWDSARWFLGLAGNAVEDCEW
jgi:hypothetical protein